MSTVTKIKPLGDRVLVKPAENKETKKGGIIIPDTAKEKPMEGEVVAVGPGKISDSGTRMEMDIKKGDKVLYGKYSGTEVKIDDVEYLIMSSDDVMAIIHEK
ncbi:MAG: co-chaperone GroES [Candidatus Edwardsbacteria bacterium]|nr:co-chaperone GroES [Candidatus Edwardsbacteria bacterium]MBU1575711.1 co-chaperone GroES [Candidatus Edwardsbacteria bacterium]MBU2464106.1 co-chaperone GroES [Candidatus Edwardsbacteria bacterium]MBU2594676.1 co-chaperone GroES [Candidatus Edwardsbacteria bacterium]